MPVNMTQRMAQLKTDVRSNQKKNQFSNLMLNISFHTQNIYYTSRTKPFPLNSNCKRLQRKTLFHEKIILSFAVILLEKKTPKVEIIPSSRKVFRYSWFGKKCLVECCNKNLSTCPPPPSSSTLLGGGCWWFLQKHENGRGLWNYNFIVLRAQWGRLAQGWVMAEVRWYFSWIFPFWAELNLFN